MRCMNNLIQGLLIIGIWGMTSISGMADESEAAVTLLYDHYSTQDAGVVPGARFAAYTYTKNMTRVERGGRTDFIDYTNLVLYRYFQTSDECRIYRLLASDFVVSDLGIEDQAMHAKMLDIGSVEVVKVATQEKRVREYPVQDKKVIWGGQAAVHRTVTEPAIVMYGQLFSPMVNDYSVTTVIDRIDDLFRLAASHEAVYRVNPLLRRLDPLGLLGGLQGIPVKIRTEEFVEEFRDIRYAGGSAEIVLPASCHLSK